MAYKKSTYPAWTRRQMQKVILTEDIYTSPMSDRKLVLKAGTMGIIISKTVNYYGTIRIQFEGEGFTRLIHPEKLEPHE